MAKHLNNRDLSLILAGYKKKRLMNHLSSCPDCRKRFDEAVRILEPVKNIDEISPSPLVKERVLATYRKRSNESRRKTLFGSGAYLKPVTASVLIAASVITAFIIIRPSHPDSFRMSFQMVLLPDDTSRYITGEMDISVAADKRVIITRANDFKLLLAPETKINFVTAEINSETGEEILSLKLENGIVSASFQHRSDRKYSIVTPQGRLDSIGTRFILSVESGTTEIFLQEGSLRLKKDEGQAETITEGSHWSMTNTSLQALPPDPEKEKKLNQAVSSINEPTGPAPVIQKTGNSVKAERKNDAAIPIEKSGHSEKESAINIKKTEQKDQREEHREFKQFRREQKNESLQEWKRMKREIQHGK